MVSRGTNDPATLCMTLSLLVCCFAAQMRACCEAPGVFFGKYWSFRRPRAFALDNKWPHGPDISLWSQLNLRDDTAIPCSRLVLLEFVESTLRRCSLTRHREHSRCVCGIARRRSTSAPHSHCGSRAYSSCIDGADTVERKSASLRWLSPLTRTHIRSSRLTQNGVRRSG